MGFKDLCDSRTAYVDPSPGRDGYRWLDSYQPITRLGGSIRIYLIPPREPTTGARP